MQVPGGQAPGGNFSIKAEKRIAIVDSCLRWAGENEQLNYYYTLVLGRNTLVTVEAKGSWVAEVAAAEVQSRKGLGNPSWVFLRPIPLTQAIPCVPNVLTLLRSHFLPPQGTLGVAYMGRAVG